MAGSENYEEHHMYRAGCYTLALLLSSVSLSTNLQRQSLAQFEDRESPELPTSFPESVDERAAFTIQVSDRDGDGKIARSEAPGPVYRDNFDRFDLDRDGILVLSELKAAASQMQLSPRAIASFRQYLERYDKDKDGRISQTEAETDTDLETGFANSDLDHDGFLSEYEVAAKVRTSQVIKFQKKYMPSDQNRRESTRTALSVMIAKGWLGTSNSGEYSLGKDNSVAHGGQSSAYIKATHGSRSFAQFNQTVRADKYAGKRVELSAYIKSEDSLNGTGNSGVWFRVDGSSTKRAFDNMLDRGFKGTHDWRKATVILDIPEDAVSLLVGGIRQGTGTAWFDDFELRIVDEDIQVTQPTTDLAESQRLSKEERQSFWERTQQQAAATLVNVGFESNARLLGVALTGNKVTSVLEGSLGQNLGLEAGDELLRIDDHKIKTASDVREAIYAKGGERTLRLLRDRMELSFKFQTIDAEPKHKNASELNAAPSPGRLPPMTAEAAKQFLSRFDTDKDGVISVEEGKRGPFARNFKRWDADSNGTIDVDELLESGLRVSAGGPQDFLEVILGRSDKDGDGQLSADELPPILERFMDKLDKNEDGTLSAKELEELPNVLRGSQSTTGGGRSSRGQRADRNFEPNVSKATYSDTDAPTIAIDAGHQNFHTKEGRYRACAKVLEADGVKVIEHSEKFSEDSLASIDILLIANALPKGRFSRGAPVPSAFSDSEIGVLVRWIESGGSLLLLADHAPYGEAAKKLGSALGVDMQGGFVLGPDKTNPGRITFARADESLLPHAVTIGSGKETKLDSVVTFTGQALKGDDRYAPILTLPEGVSYRANRGAAGNSEALPDLRGWHQGIVGQIGEGRVAAFGEAGMFSAQLSGSDRKMGMNAEGAEQNQQLLLNLVHWLNGDL